MGCSQLMQLSLAEAVVVKVMLSIWNYEKLHLSASHVLAKLKPID